MNEPDIALIAPGKPGSQSRRPERELTPLEEAVTQGVGATPVEENDGPADPKRKGMARRVAFMVLALIVALVAWYAATDRIAPYSSRGTVSAYVAQIAPRVSGQVTDVFVRDNQILQGGTSLFALDSRLMEVAVKQAEANLAKAIQATDAETVGILANEAAVTEAKANLETVRATAARARALAERGIVSKAQQTAADADVSVAEARLNSAEAKLKSALASLGLADGENPNISLARAQLENARLNLQFSTVVAPTDGVVTNLQLAIGQYVSAGTPTMTFIDGRGAWISVDMRENQLGNIDPGDPVSILFDAVPGRLYTGKVHSIAWGINPGRSSSGGLIVNQPENKWFEPARRIPVHIELDGGLDAWPEKVRAGSKVTAVVFAKAPSHPVSIASAFLHRIQSYASYLY
jgi:multidrug resistance efflux pump